MNASIRSGPWHPWAAVSLMAAASVWLLSAPWLGHMGPPSPCVVAGALLALYAFRLFARPIQHRGWGVLAVITSALSLLLGAQAIVPALLGLTGGVIGVVWSGPARNG